MSTDGNFNLDTSTPCQGTPPNLQADYSTCQQVVSSIAENIQQQMAQIVLNAYNATSRVTNVIATKLTNAYNQAQSCYSDCANSIQGQIVSALGTQQELLNTITPESIIGTLATQPIEGITANPVIPPTTATPIVPQLPATTPALPGTITPQLPATSTSPCPPCPPCPIQPGQPIIVTTTNPVPIQPGGGLLPWIGWCKQPGGIIFASQVGVAPPDPTWQVVCIAASEQEALNCARANCPQNQPTTGTPTGPQVQYPAGAISETCDITKFESAELIAGLLGDLTPQGITGDLSAYLQGVLESSTNIPVVGSLIDATANVACAITGGPFAFATKTAALIAPYMGCTLPEFTQSLGVVATMQSWGRTAGVDVSQFTTPYVYAANALCRRTQLTPDQAVAAYLADAFSPEILDTHWAIAGLCPESLAWHMQASRAKPVPQELVVLRRRAIISAATYAQQMRQLGYIDSTSADNIFAISELLPDQQRVESYATNQLALPNGTDVLALDTGVNTLLGGQFGQWLNSAGVGLDYATEAWKGHWRTPGIGEIFTVFHRLRTRPDVVPLDSLTDQVSQMIGRHGYAPVAAQRLHDIIYQPLSIRYARLAYQVGGITRDRMRQVFTDMGLSDDDASGMLSAADAQKLASAQASKPVEAWRTGAITGDDVTSQLSNYGFSDDDIRQILTDASPYFERSDDAKLFLSGALPADQLATRLANNGVPQEAAENIVGRLGERMSRHPAVEDYAAGTLARDDATQQMSDYGVDPDLAESLLNRVDRKIKNASANNCLRSFKRQYLTGAFDDAALTAKLIAYGITLERANLLTAAWQCELYASDKNVTLAMLTDWFNQGLISSSEFTKRLELMGFADVDAAIILTRAMSKLTAAEQKLAEQQAKKQAAQQAAAAKAAAKLQRGIAAENKAIAKANAAYNTIKLRRQKQLLQAAEYIYKGCNCGFTQAVESANAIYKDLQSQADLTQDQALAIMVRVGETLGSSTIDAYSTAVLDAATGLDATSVHGASANPTV